MTKIKYCRLSTEAEQVLQQFAPHQQNLQALRQRAGWPDVITYTIFMLPYRQALELTLTFISRVYEHQLKQEPRQLLQQVKKWHLSGGDILRHQLFEQAEIMGFDNPVSGLALSVFLSEGSLTKAELEAIYPPSWQSLMMLVSTVNLILSISAGNPETSKESAEQFFCLAQGALARLSEGPDTGRKNYLYQESELKEIF